MTTPLPPRAVLEQIFQAALASVGGAAAVRRHLEQHPLQGAGVSLIAIGKAAASMCHGALDVLDDQLQRGLLITKHDHLSARCRLDPRLECIEASHPVPDASSLHAGQLLLAFIDAVPAEHDLLILISGGASSLVDVLPDGYGLRDLELLNRWLLSNHLDIGQMNAIRRSVSCIKGGRLAARLGGRGCRLLLISDVPGDQPWVIGSGLLVPPGPAADLPALVLPAGLAAMQNAAPPLPDPADPAFNGIDAHVIASNSQARTAAAAHARALGIARVHIEPDALTGDALLAGERIARATLKAGPGVWVHGGETTVSLPASPGRGGRAQALALRAAMAFEGHRGVWLLAAGTDGTDGPGEDAGALVDGGTCERGRSAGLDPDHCLDAADSGRFLDASGDLLRTGPTGTNVMDLVITLRLPDGAPSGD